MIRAAGGLVWRDGRHGREVLVVHRPKYDDWSFPKGKAEAGEDDLACALREVEEETGLRCRAGDELGSALYRDGRGRRKVVRFWSMTPSGGCFEPNAEVDQVAWLPLDQVQDRLTYHRDRAILLAWKED